MTTREARYAAVLAEHQFTGLGVASECRCGNWHILTAEVSHRTHLAAALAALDDEAT